MTKTISLSISDDGFEYVLFEDPSKTKCLESNQVKFLSRVSPEKLFSEEILGWISKTLAEEIKADCSDLLVVVPFSHATLKKIIIPANSPQSQKRSLIKWELESVLPKPMNRYKVSVVSSKNLSEISEILNVVALDKNLINNLNGLAQQLDLELKGVFLDCFSLENNLKKREPATENSMISKINKNYVEHHVFSGNDYYLTYIDLISRDDRGYFNVVSGLIDDRRKKSMSVLKQSSASVFDKMQIYIYGSDVTAESMAVIQNQISTELKLPDFFEMSSMAGTADTYNYIEAYGALL